MTRRAGSGGSRTGSRAVDDIAHTTVGRAYARARARADSIHPRRLVTYATFARSCFARRSFYARAKAE